MNAEQRLVQKRSRLLEHAKKTGNVRRTCRYFGIARSSFYRWNRAYDRDGESGLVKKPRVARNHPNQLSKEVVDRVLYLRKIHTLNPLMAHCFLDSGSKFITLRKNSFLNSPGR